MYKIKSIYDYKEEEGKVFTQPSLTEPDLSLTVRELLQMHTHGGLPDVHILGQNDGEEITFDDYQRFMDLDYDLPDLTQDKLRLMELKEETDKAIAAKVKKRQDAELAEKKELEQLREYKKRLEAEKQVSETKE